MTIIEMNPDFPFDKLESFILDKGLLRYDTSITLPKQFSEKALYDLIDRRKYHRSYVVENDDVNDLGYFNSTITDILRLSKYYYPELSLINVYNSLITLINERSITSWICAEIHKRTYCVYHTHAGGMMSEPIDEYGVIYKGITQGYPAIYGLTNTHYNLQFIKFL